MQENTIDDTSSALAFLVIRRITLLYAGVMQRNDPLL